LREIPLHSHGPAPARLPSASTTASGASPRPRVARCQ
jgi:hypothetical protein